MLPSIRYLVILLSLQCNVCAAFLSSPAFPLTPTREPSLYAVHDELHAADSSLTSRKQVLWTLGSSILSITLIPLSGHAADKDARISACVKPPGGGSANCVSTASVKQVDLYMAPWTWPEGISVDEVVGRLKGAIVADATLSLDEQRDNRYFRVRAARNFCTDEIEFVVNPVDRVVTFRSQQIEGPDNVSDFGANRKRLDELRRRTTVLDVMGAEFETADSAPREGTVGQLKSFWGLQSGEGYESILLDDDEEE
jgi:uncharacterized protein (DUF1499 family)